MHSSILVPLDGSSLGNRAFPLACFLAKRSRASLHIAHVFRRDGQSSGAPAHEVRLDVELENLTRMVIRTQAAAIPADDLRNVVTTFLEGNVAQSIEHYARSKAIDLIVMATRGHGEGHRPLLGSVTNDLIQRTTTPVLLAPPGSHESTASRDPFFGSILIALDGRCSSEAVIDYAVAFADPETTRFTLLTSVTPVPDRGLLRFRVGLDRRATRRAAVSQRSYLEKIARELRANGFSVETTVRATDAPDMGILELLEARQFDLVALAVDGAEHALERMLGMTLLERLLRHTRCNILVCNTNPHHADDTETAEGLNCAAPPVDFTALPGDKVR
jgi:nucleotide-binding universal stress UspA family protein